MTKPKLSHSKMGIASFCISLLVLPLMVFSAEAQFRIEDYIPILTFALIGVGLAISGMFYRHRNRLFPLLGGIINAASLIAFLMIRPALVGNQAALSVFTPSSFLTFFAGVGTGALPLLYEAYISKKH
ncbi:hypothetical protein IQ235_08220 [Oscillatoriales cyanobacterium LEGE 11467]|uniref:Uncharacterized protein n=1 Tax=Zarconia navalis LEGE 11467 TaxID=1828826 RepID=A0A928Z6U4_9CYAN|nr:hypothetical protein [Zarconia navalis]MBE9040762.1 hypothetical protein [Zarconia navalis LEGE 11467]